MGLSLISPEDMQNWLQNNGSWDHIVKYDVATVINSFQSRDNISEVGIFGMCWGGKVATLAATEIDEIKAAGLVHPSSVSNSEADGVRAPMYLCPTKDEPDMVIFLFIERAFFLSEQSLILHLIILCAATILRGVEAKIRRQLWA